MIKKCAHHVRVALAMLPEQRHFTVANNLAAMLKLAVKAGRAGSDIVAFEENGIHLFVPKQEKGARVPGPETDRLGKVARTYSMYIAATMSEKTAHGYHNVVVLIDRQGDIQYVYRKQQLTDGELMNGIVPGDECRPVQTDFGRIAFQICYDTQFPELARTLGVMKTDLLICPHVGGAGPDGGRLIGSAFAYQNYFWLAWVGRYNTTLINPYGVEIARLDRAGNLLVTDIEFDRIRIVPQMHTAFVGWNHNQFLQRRPDHYRHAEPAVQVESPAMPYYLGNPLTPGRHKTELVLTNRSAVRQRGELTVSLPLPADYQSDEFQPMYIHQRIAENWLCSGRTLQYDLAPEKKTSLFIDWCAPAGRIGIFLARVEGFTAAGSRVFWQHQFNAVLAPPSLTVLELKRSEDIAVSAAKVPLILDFFGCPADSHSLVRFAYTQDALLIRAEMKQAGQWNDKNKGSGEAFSVAFSDSEPERMLYWLTVNFDGSRVEQRRENGYQVQGPVPEWNVNVTRKSRSWTADLRIPFSFCGGRPGKGSVWHMNFERHAILTRSRDRLRDLSIVRTPSCNTAEKKRVPATEWVCWNPHYSRIDCAKYFGNLRFG